MAYISSEEELSAWGESFEAKSPQEVLASAIERYAPKIVLACSFGAEDVVLLDMVHRINPSVPLFYLDTDFLFPETYATRDRVIERYGLEPQQVNAARAGPGHAQNKEPPCGGSLFWQAETASDQEVTLIASSPSSVPLRDDFSIQRRTRSASA